MTDSQTLMLTRSANVAWETRPGAEDNGGRIAYAAAASGSSLASGFGRLRKGETPLKTLDYDEVIHVLQGTLTVHSDGAALSASAGDVLALRRGSTVRYAGTDAEFFFVITAA